MKFLLLGALSLALVACRNPEIEQLESQLDRNATNLRELELESDSLRTKLKSALASMEDLRPPEVLDDLDFHAKRIASLEAELEAIQSEVEESEEREKSLKKQLTMVAEWPPLEP